MDLKKYYAELQEKEASLEGKDLYVVSLATSDGGKAGIFTQVAKRLGCQLMVEGKARLASKEEVEAYENEQAEARASIESQAFASRIQVQLVTDGKGGLRQVKGKRE
jgi:hypothetical protein